MDPEAVSKEHRPGPGPNCPGCGSQIADVAAGVCAICGKQLSEGFQPLDAIRSSYGLQRKKLEFQAPAALFETRRPLASTFAWACTVYSMVPYLGILFVPFAFLFGGANYIGLGRSSQPGDRRNAAGMLILTGVLLAIQLFLWALLYIIPRIGI